MSDSHQSAIKTDLEKFVPMLDNCRRTPPSDLQSLSYIGGKPMVNWLDSFRFFGYPTVGNYNYFDIWFQLFHKVMEWLIRTNSSCQWFYYLLNIFWIFRIA